MRKHEQKANEIVKTIQAKQSKQKNAHGGYGKGHITSPERQALNKQNISNRQKIIDLSNDKTDETRARNFPREASPKQTKHFKQTENHRSVQR
jgi:hypothetical protein